MITVAIAEMFFFIEFSPLSAYTGGENGLPGVPTPRFALFGWTYQVGTGWSMYGFLAVCYFVGMVLALRIVRSPVGAIFSAIRDNPLRAPRGRPCGRRLQADRLRHRRRLCRVRRRPARRAAGLHAARRVHVRHLRPAGDADRDRRQPARCSARCSARRYGCSCAISCKRALGLGAAWKLVLGVVFVLLVCFLRRGLIGGIARPGRRFATAPARRAPPEEAPRDRRRRRHWPASARRGAARRRRFPARCWRRAA